MEEKIINIIYFTAADGEWKEKSIYCQQFRKHLVKIMERILCMKDHKDHEEDDILALLLGGSVNNYHPIKKNKHTGRKDWIWHTAEFLKQTQRERKEIMSEINFQITNELFVE